MEDGSREHPITITEGSGLEMARAGAEVLSKTEPRSASPTRVVLRTPFEGHRHYTCLTDHPELFPSP
jgi:hypothetical protein